MAFGIGDSLSIRVSAQTRDFTSGIRRAREKLGGFSRQALETSGVLQILSGRADEAGDELSETGRKATTASGGMGVFAVGTEGAAFSVRGLSLALIASLIPALVTLSGALVPIVAALGGFVAVAGAIAGVGLGASLGAIATHTTALKAVFTTIVDTIKTEFAPVFDEAAQVLAILGSRFQDIIPQMVPAEDTISRLSELFAELGATLIENIPAFVKLATTLATEFLPPFLSFVHDVLPQVPGMIQGMASEFKRVAPLFLDLGRFLGRLLPKLLKFGHVALDVVAGSLGQLGEMLLSGLDAFNKLDGGLKKVTLKASLLAPVLAGLATLLGGISAPVLAVVGAVALLSTAFQRDFGQIRGTLAIAGGAFQRVLGDRVPTLLAELKQLWRTLRPVVEPALNFIVQLLSFGVVSALDLVLAGVTALVQVLNGDFSAAWDTAAGAVGRFMTRLGEFLNSLSGGAFQKIINQFIQGLNKIGVARDKFLKEVGLGGQANFKQIEQVDIGTTPLQQNQKNQGESSKQTDQRVVVELKDEMLDAKVKEGANAVVSSRERRTTRNSGTTATPR